MNRAGPVPLYRLDTVRLGRAKGLASSLLRGVGIGEEFWKLGEKAVHLRRKLTDEEIAGLSAEWMALPAIDLAE